MRLLLEIIFVGILLLKTLEAVDISCSAISSPTMCVVSEVSIQQGEPINYVNIDPAVTAISFRSCNMTKIPARLFGNFTQLKVATFQTAGLKQLIGNDLKNSTKVYNMMFSNNMISVLKNGVFKYSPSLEILMMVQNTIAKVSVNTFYGANSIKFLIMCFNELKAFPTGIFGFLKTLMNVDFSYNKLTKISKSLFR